MKDRVVLKTNLLICIIIVVGFLLTALLSYKANYSESIKSMQHVSDLISEGIYHQMNNILGKPVNISLTMANDRLLKDFLIREPQHMEDQDYSKKISKYLSDYKTQYGYDSVFLVSSVSSRYYNFNGVDRVLNSENPEDFWYYDVLLQSDAEYAMNVDNDQVPGADNAVTLFVNCKINDDQGNLIGVVGVGMRIGQLQSMIREYQTKFGVNTYFTDDNGRIELSADYSGYESVSLFDINSKVASWQKVLNWKEDGEPFSFWNMDRIGQKQDYIVARYLPGINWHLIVERDTQALVNALTRQLIITFIVIFIIIGAILLIVTHVIRRFNHKIVNLTQTYEQERKTMFEKATEQMFEDIYEIDISHNKPANQVTEQYFQRLGVPIGASYDESLHIIAEKQIKEEFRQGYLDTFCSENVLKAFREGIESLRYEFMISNGGEKYYWMRITTRLILSENDGSLHMLVYRQNIDVEKRKEQKMQKLACTDEMTGFLSKAATERDIMKKMCSHPKKVFALFIFDIDHFKDANDLFGHSFGDEVIREFTAVIRSHFSSDDILGRIGGDEFVVFSSVTDEKWVLQKAAEMNEALNKDYVRGSERWHISSSIGIAFAPRDGACFEQLYRHADSALYETKKHGRNGFTLYKNDVGNEHE